MNSPRLSIPLLLLAPILAAGCSPTPTAEPAPTATWSDGHPVLVVRNNTGMDVEIVESRRLSSSLRVIAEVGPGQHRQVSIRGETGYHYSARPVGSKTSINGETNGRTDQVLMTRECR